MITINDIAEALGTTPTRLGQILNAGAARVGASEAEAALAVARAKSEELLMPDRQAITELQIALDTRSAAHAAVIERLTAYRDELSAGQRSDTPDFAEMIKEIE